MLDYKDVRYSRDARPQRRWRGPLLLLLAAITLVGGLAFLAFDSHRTLSDLRAAKQPRPRVESPSIKANQTKKDSAEPAPIDQDAPPVTKAPRRTPAGRLERSPVKVEAKANSEGKQVPGNDKTGKPEKAAKPAAPPRPAEPHYDFYTMLPAYEVVIPEEELRAGKPESPDAPPQPLTLAPGNAYLLQVGSFRSEAQAEDTRGRLALLGFEASIHESTDQNGTRWYRVRIGPYLDQNELDDVRSLLRAEGFRVLPLRLKRRK